MSDRIESPMTSQQINVLIDKFFEWYGSDEQKWREETLEEYQQFSKEYFISLSDREFVEVMVKFFYDGGKIQTGGPRNVNEFRESVERQGDKFRQQILDIFSDDFDVEKWWNQMDAFKGFGNWSYACFNMSHISVFLALVYTCKGVSPGMDAHPHLTRPQRGGISHDAAPLGLFRGRGDARLFLGLPPGLHI